jgi:hypothetical protein
MTEYVLTSPLAIGPRLMPAAIIAPGTDTYGTISVEIDSYDEGPAAVIHYFIDTPSTVYEATDVRIRPLYTDDTPSDIAARAIATLCSFLGAEAEGYQFSGNMGANEPRDGWFFSAEIAEWAYLNSDELGMLRDEIEGDEG